MAHLAGFRWPATSTATPPVVAGDRRFRPSTSDLKEPVLQRQPKWKMVSFRLSKDEYAESLQLCRASGYNSMSRFALCAMRSLVSGDLKQHSESIAHSSEVDELRRRVDELASELKLLSETVRR